MASSFYRFTRLTRRSVPSTVAVATATTLAAAVAFSESDNRSSSRVDDDTVNVNAGIGGSNDSLRHRLQSIGMMATGNGNNGNNNKSHNHSSSLYYSPAFASLGRSVALCEAQPNANAPSYKPKDPAEPTADPAILTSSDGKEVKVKAGMWGEEGDGLYHGLFPRRQLWRPHLEYPLWDPDWDGRRPPPIPQPEEGAEDSKHIMTDSQRERHIRRNGVTKHVIMIRHGQYDETHREDAKRLLTPLGRKQAEMTGKRLGKLLRGVNEEFGPCRVKVVRVSDLARAKETADIIYDNMGLDDFDGEMMVEKAEPDPLLNEGRPCHHIPGGRARPSVVERTDDHHPRIEQAFRKYFFRAEMPALPTLDGEENGGIIATTSDESKTKEEGETQQQIKPHPQHEFEIIVCHANVIRYFFCRALQLPPEAWLRLCTFNCSLTYFTIRPTGTVSCRMLGDIGHLPHDLCTFSMHTGFNW